MTEIEDTRTEEEIEEIEERMQESRREKTKYGSQITSDNDED